MRKKVIFFIGIVLLALAAYGFYLYNKPRVGVDNIQPDITIRADDLYKQYNADETLADKEFLNKIVAVTGIVDEVNRNDSSYTILLKKKENMGGVSCSLSGKINTDIKPSQTLTIKGRCTGFLMDVALTDCVIENHN